MHIEWLSQIAQAWVPLALVVVAIVALAISMRLLRRRATWGTPAQRATYQTLHSASTAALHLRDGLNATSAARAARTLRPLLGVEAVVIADPQGTLAWEGYGEHHRDSVGQQASAVLEHGRSTRIGASHLQCAVDNCPIRHAVLAPIVSDERVVAVLGSYSSEVTADLVRATEAVAAWISTQVDVAELGRARHRAMEAELRALRAQISPHFIYNALGAIASFVRTDPERARELLIEFADFSRYSFRHTSQLAPLAEELGNVERYLALESARFGDRLNIGLSVAPEVLSVAVPCLAIQPLVENAVKHGIEAREGVGHVMITARDLGPEVEIIVEDDGAGAPPEVMHQVLAGEYGGDHVGVSNVDARLRQTFGDEYGLSVETAEGAGMKVSFRVPKYAPTAST